ncbi:unnamed protein product [Zymoseptoria tritici ST99CH_3D7]|uniref:Uncharacterized protein n=1 Tax=Zymoseptoria tritici (strain ST99CH_3D7) TaxID=1276538 RepID=A0A1X7RHS8_ZYMT9|nr:unnamed protein product [Zymoseptoria tritici ST99CH_3D7]
MAESLQKKTVFAASRQALALKVPVTTAAVAIFVARSRAPSAGARTTDAKPEVRRKPNASTFGLEESMGARMKEWLSLSLVTLPTHVATSEIDQSIGNEQKISIAVFCPLSSP